MYSTEIYYYFKLSKSGNPKNEINLLCSDFDVRLWERHNMCLWQQKQTDVHVRCPKTARKAILKYFKAVKVYTLNVIKVLELSV